MLDEIVCLGSNFPTDSTNQHRVSGKRNRALDLRHHLIEEIAGVVLRVKQPAEYNLTFYREKTSVVQIGRRSGHEPDNAHSVPLTSAMFRCAVVSRKHAKIVFSDSGHVRPICVFWRYVLISVVRHTSSIQDHITEPIFASSENLIPECLNRKHPLCSTTGILSLLASQ